MDRAKLYGIPASNSVLTAQLALERKGIRYRRVDQIVALHRLTMRVRRFGGGTVPGLSIEGRKIHGSMQILRSLDELSPGAPLFPSDPSRRRAVEEAVRWGEEVWQPAVRELLPYAVLRSPGCLPSLLEDAQMWIPVSIVARLAKPNVWAASKYNHSNEQRVRGHLAALPDRLDYIDGLIAEGVLDAQEPGAADLMIAPTTVALMWFEDLRPVIEGRPAAEHARRVVPRYPGSVPPLLPADAVEALRNATAARTPAHG